MTSQERLNALREENYKSRIDMTEKITESLNVIRQNNIEQNFFTENNFLSRKLLLFISVPI